MFLEEAIKTLQEKRDLSEEQCKGVIEEIIEGKGDAATFLKLLHEKGETAEELCGTAKAMQEKMIPVKAPFPLLDIVGTGGDGSHSVNISTGSAILVAASGVKVAKHGNRASSSKCGSADVLEALGISLDQDPLKSLEKVGICFLYAPLFHPAMKVVAPIRKALGIRTVFNLIGPLLNPARPDFLFLGVAKMELLDLFATAQQKLGGKKSLIVHGNGMDELTPIGPCHLIEVTKEGKKAVTFDPKEYGFSRCTASDLKGGTKEENSRLLIETFKGKKGPIGDTLILNAGVALYLSEHVLSIQEGISLAQKTLEEGKAFDLLERWKKL
ncbi:MAG: anthranilate phosphoribosyltransferase [Chlamydiia bacterium]|nr:anthranilate phosphoribosyltransferase [Chlamydiia bacterium]